MRSNDLGKLEYFYINLIYASLRYSLLYTLLLLVSFFMTNTVHAQQRKDIAELNREIVQIYGVVRTENNIPLPEASVFVEGTNRGTLTNAKGIYSIVVSKGDKIRLSYIGFKEVSVEIPKTLVSETYNIDFKLVEDTTLLPTTIVKSLPGPAKFEREFLTMDVDLQAYDIVQYNNSREMLLSMMKSTPRDGTETGSRQVLNMTPGQAMVNGQPQAVNILRPASWRSLIKDWKEGGTSRN